MAMLPAAALAADTGKAIQLVSGGSAANIGGSQKDNVFFGNYFQSNRTTKDPVKWRVLSNAGRQLFLLSDQNLDALQYHTEQEDVTWETSTIRSWLNGYDASSNTGGSNGIDYTGDNFLDTAFSAKEQTAIAETNVVNDDNDETGADIPIDAGDDTTDRIFLLSLTETYKNISQTTAFLPIRPMWRMVENSDILCMESANPTGGGCVPLAPISRGRRLSNGRTVPPLPMATL